MSFQPSTRWRHLLKNKCGIPVELLFSVLSFPFEFRIFIDDSEGQNWAWEFWEAATRTNPKKSYVLKIPSEKIRPKVSQSVERSQSELWLNRVKFRPPKVNYVDSCDPENDNALSTTYKVIFVNTILM